MHLSPEMIREVILFQEKLYPGLQFKKFVGILIILERFKKFVKVFLICIYCRRPVFFLTLFKASMKNVSINGSEILFQYKIITQFPN